MKIEVSGLLEDHKVVFDVEKTVYDHGFKINNVFITPKGKRKAIILFNMQNTKEKTNIIKEKFALDDIKLVTLLENLKTAYITAYIENEVNYLKTCKFFY